MKRKKDNSTRIIFSAFIVVVLDQILKYFFRFNSFDFGFLKLSLVKNTGAGFGILQGQNSLLVWVSIIVIGAMLYFHERIPDSKFALIMFGFILGGAFGNLIDRLILGYVIDFIDFGFWPAFNIADSALTIGVIGLIVYYWKK